MKPFMRNAITKTYGVALISDKDFTIAMRELKSVSLDDECKLARIRLRVWMRKNGITFPKL